MTIALAIDGTNLLHRGYHALAQTDMRTPQGNPVWAIHGLLTNVAKLAKGRRYDTLVIAFDTPGGCPSRKALNPEYKANRQRPNDDLRIQLDAAPKILAAAGLGVVTLAGWEADDLLASVAESCETAGHSCDIVSSDRDLYQLVTDRVHVLKPDGERYDAAAVTRKTGVTPARYPHLAAMRGEPGDNLAGIRGVGPVTATKLLTVHPDLDAAVAADDLEALVGKANAAKLRDGADIYRRNLEIGRLKRDLEVAEVLEAGKLPVDVTKIAKVLERHGLPVASRQLNDALAGRRYDAF